MCFDLKNKIKRKVVEEETCVICMPFFQGVGRGTFIYCIIKLDTIWDTQVIWLGNKNLNSPFFPYLVLRLKNLRDVALKFWNIRPILLNFLFPPPLKKKIQGGLIPQVRLNSSLQHNQQNTSMTTFEKLKINAMRNV